MIRDNSHISEITINHQVFVLIKNLINTFQQNIHNYKDKRKYKITKKKGLDVVFLYIQEQPTLLQILKFIT